MTDEQDTVTDTTEKGNDEFTDETDVRVKWLGSVMAAFVIISFFGLIYAVALGYASFDPIVSTFSMVFTLVVLAAATWTFGIDLIDKYTGRK